ncbi:hypothetical protein HPP92_007949 [Vanilla planifolia]|uniref:Uncharacterized protein n=1 Tax=Vanilla planifolia TaxID=51239 RepID=A0A835RMZ6_VANPL|nr:hypothetical protein HPP92_007949 [Vanilla planifolia]
MDLRRICPTPFSFFVGVRLRGARGNRRCLSSRIQQQGSDVRGHVKDTGAQLPHCCLSCQDAFPSSPSST